MKYQAEYRDATALRDLSAAIASTAKRHWTLMEICGGQTHTIVRFGLDQLLPATVHLVHGPGCPVCVTSSDVIDRAVALAARPEVILCTFGDMLRVPGSRHDLTYAKAAGGDVRGVYSPMEALALARVHPERQVVFFAVGFETTAPAVAMAVHHADAERLENFSVLVAHVRVPPAMEAILSAPENRVQGFLAAGHVCTIMGTEEYVPIVARHRVPVVVTGFEPVDILHGVLLCVRQLEAGRADLENQYDRSVRSAGNLPARAMLAEVFRVVPRTWRGLGEIPESGFALARAYARFDAARRFPMAPTRPATPSDCQSGLVLQGRLSPPECPAFGTRCTPEAPLGAPMVSSEGACAAYYRYRGRHAAAVEAR